MLRAFFIIYNYVCATYVDFSPLNHMWSSYLRGHIVTNVKSKKCFPSYLHTLTLSLRHKTDYEHVLRVFDENCYFSKPKFGRFGF